MVKPIHTKNKKINVSILQKMSRVSRRRYTRRSAAAFDPYSDQYGGWTDWVNPAYYARGMVNYARNAIHDFQYTPARDRNSFKAYYQKRRKAEEDKRISDDALWWSNHPEMLARIMKQQGIKHY
jgi:hypothetical protein